MRGAKWWALRNRKNARGKVEGSSRRGEICSLRGLGRSWTSETFELCRLMQTERDTLQARGDSHGGSVRVAGGGAGGINLP